MVSNHCHDRGVPKLVRLLFAKSNLKHVLVSKKQKASCFFLYLAIRSQPDADVEDLVIVEESEGEGAVHSTVSAVSHQKTPILSDCKRRESESVLA